MDSSSHEKLPPFLRKTWDIVEDHSTDHIVRWSASGRSFVVLDVESFAKEILPRFFKHSNWSSFVRQLNTYGFRKIDPDRWEFANENFSKGGKDLLNSIQRRKPTLTSTMTALVGQGRPQDVGPPVQHTAPAQHQHPQGADYILAPPYPLDLRQPASVPLFHPSAQGPGPPGMAGLPAAYGMPGLAVGHDARMAGMVGTPHSRQAMGGAGGSSKPTVPMQIIMQEQQQQQAPAAQQHPHPGLQQQQPHQQQQQQQQQQQEQAQIMQGVTMQSVESREAAPGSGSGGPAGMDRMAVLMEEYLRPGQRILANIQQPLELHQLHDSHSTSATSGPSGSTENDDTEEARKINKRTRADLHSGRATAGAGSSSSGGPDTATWYPPNPRTATFGPFIRTHAVEYPSVPGNTSLDKDGIPLPAGITRPKPQALGITTQSLISEMAGQIGRLTQLATEVQDLRQDNAQLRHGMDMVMSRGQPAADVAPIHAILAEQNDSMWQYKLKSDEVSTGMQLQLNAQHSVQAVQQERSAALEAQARKLAFDTAEVARSLEIQNVDLARKLAYQENINQQQHHSNQQLEARVAELEQQLSGRQERMLKGLEDRMMMAMSEMLVKQTPAAGPHPEGTAADAAALADALKHTLTTGASSSGEQGAASAAASPLTEPAHTGTPRSDGTSSAAQSAG